MMLVGFLGCYGAIQESQCLLGTVSDLYYIFHISFEHLSTTLRLFFNYKSWPKATSINEDCNHVFFSFAVVFLLFGDPLCLWGGCSDLGLHEQGHSEWAWFLFPLDVFSLFLLLICPQISKELINFYDSAYIKAVDVSGSPSKDAAIKILDVFHSTVCSDVDPSQTAKSVFFSRQPSDHLSFFHLSAWLLR